MSPTQMKTPCVKEALLHKSWKIMMKTEFDTLIKNREWELIPCNSTYNIIDNIWLFKIKEKSEGTVERLKVRLLANGTHQIEGRDYNKIISSIVEPVSIRMVLCIVVSKKLCFEANRHQQHLPP